MNPFGKSCIAKTLLLSKINHLVFVLPTITKKKLKEIEAIIFEFIWGGKNKDKVCRRDVVQDLQKGAFRLPRHRELMGGFQILMD